MTIREKINSFSYENCKIIINYYFNVLSDDRTHRTLYYDEEYSFSHEDVSTIFDSISGYDWILDIEVDGKSCSCVYDGDFAIFTVLSYDYQE